MSVQAHPNPFLASTIQEPSASRNSPMWWDEQYDTLSSIPRIQPRHPKPEEGSLPLNSTFVPSASANAQQQQQRHDVSKYNQVTNGDITGTIFGVPQSVFQVQEVTKLLMFAGLAVGTIVLLDVSMKFILSMAAQRRN